MEKSIKEYTKEELLAIENFGKDNEFNAVVIVPTDEIHDSGYRNMKFILLKNLRIVGAVSGWSDVIHINGIGGYGRNWEESLRTGLVKRVNWCIDCLSVSGCLRLFTSQTCHIGDFVGSDFEIFAEG